METAVAAIRSSRAMVALAIAGGGSGVIPRLLTRPGASRTVLEAQVPYGRRALTELLGAKPASRCSPEAARELAQAVYRRALRLRETPHTPVLGLGATAALVTDRERQGAHRIHVAVVDGFRSWEASAHLRKGARTRAEEEAIAERIILGALAEAMVGGEFDLALQPDERSSIEAVSLAHPCDVIACGEQPWATVDTAGRVRAGGPLPGIVLPGSFNPLHKGHAALLEAARRRTAGFAAYEISITNVDKPPLAAAELDARLAQIRGRAPVVLTRAPTFVEKARLLPGAAFAVGADTAARILEPRYYADADGLAKALAELRELGARLHVAERRVGDRLLRLDDLPVPPSAVDMFQPIPASEVAIDISSTELRSRPAAKGHSEPPPMSFRT
ncbi:MAG: hypothetical protein OXU21_00605 [Chloroflexota bacterium]|nr:hypothetical protein [Chloroflexota bacterium]